MRAGLASKGPTAHSDHVRLDGACVTLVFGLERAGAADLVYLGAPLPPFEDLAALARSQARGLHESQPDTPPAPGLLPQRGGGWSGISALAVSEIGAGRSSAIETDLRLAEWQADAASLRLVMADNALGLFAEGDFRIGKGDVITVQWTIRNRGTRRFELMQLSSLSLPIPRRFSELTSFSGRWAGEMRPTRRALEPEGFARSSAIGKPGFGGGNWLMLHDPLSREAIGAHCAWSGDYRTVIDCDTAGAGDGRAVLQMGARWDTGEAPLPAGGCFESPAAMFALAANEDRLAQQFHTHLRATALAPEPFARERRVHINTWEAAGFDLGEADLFDLAASAAQLGAERFVLDDGWFGARRNDRAALGDWTVSQAIFANGLTPLIEHVQGLGMDFGLWVEPEMISPDSDLARAHPDWCLGPAETGSEPGEGATMRSQLVLDLTRDEVRDHLAMVLHSVLGEHNIAYLKWDHNRDLFPLAGRGLAQTRALYGLLECLRADFPQVEIESCASGGGRVDFAMLRHCRRVWPSDNNDAIERLRIMRNWARFLPLEALGNHVGPSPNPITGRRLAIDFRAKIALFGHMGIEADPRAMSEEDRAVLAAHIALYKQWRAVLHQGALWQLDHPDPQIGGLMVTQADTCADTHADTHADRALALVAQTGFAACFDAAPLRLAGLDPAARYRVSLPEPWPKRAAQYFPDPEIWRCGLTLSGAALMRQGIALPLTHPETAWLIALERLD